MPTPPNWEAAVDGVPGNLNATNHAAELTQFLGTHDINLLYTGVPLVSPAGGANFSWLTLGGTTDLSQKFTMPGGHTAVGRVTLPLNPVGNGADLMVSLVPDNAGSPNLTNILAATQVPAAFINQLSATSGLANGGPLNQPDYNAAYLTGGITQTPWAPAAGAAGVLNQAGFTSSGGFGIFVGGDDGATANANVSTVSADTSGALQPLVAQPSLPTPTTSVAVTTVPGFVVSAGGTTTLLAANTTANVWVAGWDSNTGQIGSWSAQAPLPSPVYRATASSYNNYVYVMGGFNSSNNVTGNVYFALVNNGQISAWNTVALPAGFANAFSAVIDNVLIIAGGDTNSLFAITNVWYSYLGSDGTPGPWIAGPSLPNGANRNGSPGTSQPLLSNMMGILNGNDGNFLQTLSVKNGVVAKNWVESTWPYSGFIGENFVLSTDTGLGEFDFFNMNPSGGFYQRSVLLPVPTISVPLMATGLTPASVYHVVLQQIQSTSASDYLQYGINSSALTADALKSVRHSGTWTTITAGYSTPLTVYDNAVTGRLMHTWEDPSSTGSTYTSNLATRTTDILFDKHNNLLGLCDSTAQPNDPLNINPTFTTGVANWTPVGCTFTQSSAQVHGGFPFSGLMTPNTTTNPSVTSELERIIAVAPLFNNSQWYTVNGWFYSVTGWGTFNLNINWYTSTQTLISTSSSVTSLAANTWKNVVNTFQPPSNAFYASIGIVQTGSTTNANLLYCSNVTLSSSIELTKSFATVSEVTSSSAGWPPTGITQLA